MLSTSTLFVSASTTEPQRTLGRGLLNWNAVVLMCIFLLFEIISPRWMTQEASASSCDKYVYPLEGKMHIVEPFYPGKHRWDSSHRGILLSTEVSNTVFSAGEGTVHFRGIVAGIPTISIEDPAGFIMSYQPVDSSLIPGSSVHPGSVLGTVSHGSSETASLHWGVRFGRGHDSVYMDPLVLLCRAHYYLKPQ